MESCPNPYDIFTLRNFYYYVDDKLTDNHEWGLLYPTLEQMALCYVMWLKYEMIWTGEDWEEND